jgi:hypothetical protein
MSDAAEKVEVITSVQRHRRWNAAEMEFLRCNEYHVPGHRSAMSRSACGSLPVDVKAPKKDKRRHFVLVRGDRGSCSD